MTLRTRLIVTIAGIALLLISPALYGINRLTELNRIASAQLVMHAAAYQAIGALQTRLAELDRAAVSYVISREDAERVRMFEALNGMRAPLDTLSRAGYDSTAMAGRRRIDEILDVATRVDSLIQAGQLDDGTALHGDMKALIANTYDTTIRAMVEEIDRRSAADLEAASAISATATTTAVAALLFCVLAALALGVWTTRAMTRPIVRLEAAVARVASGQFRVPDDLPYGRHDEIGSLARSFRATTRRLAELDRMKAEFMSIATHELKTPINVIGGYAELMQERVYGDVNERQTEALRAIRDQIRSLGLLVNQLLDISRLEAGGLRLQMLDVVVSDLFQRVERTFGPLAQKKQIAFSVERDPSLPATFPGDADRLRDQVLGNLLSNAMKFTPEGGRVTVSARRDNDHVEIRVSDTGPGIASDKLPYIFDKFFQVGEQARSRGAGLGLAIAHEIVEAHRGRLIAQSEPGVGTSFTIHLPATNAATAQEPAPVAG